MFNKNDLFLQRNRLIALEVGKLRIKARKANVEAKKSGAKKTGKK